MTDLALGAPRGSRRVVRQRSGLDLWGRVIVIAGVAVAVYLIAAPLAMLLVTAFRGPVEFLPFEAGARWTLDNVIEVYTDAALYRRIIPDTLVFVAGSVALSFTIGFGLAWLVERTDLPGREVWFTLILFPFLVPTIVLGIAWIFLMGPKAGWLNLALRALLGGETGEGPINVFSMGGLIVCQALASVPFVFILLIAALRTMNPALEEASGTSGASPMTTFRRVTFPMILPGILAGGLLAFTLSLDDFVITFFTNGPGSTTLPIYVYGLLRRIITPQVNALSTVWILTVFIAVLLLQILQSREQRQH